MTPRSGWRPANKESQGRNAPVAINAPPTTAADATRRSWVDGDRATLRIPGAGPNVEEEVDVSRDVPGDLRAGRIACLQGAHRGEALAGDDLVPRGGVFHPDDVELPPVSFDLVHDVTVGRERSVLRPGAEDPRHVDRGRMVDAMADHRALQRRVGGTKADGCHHEQRGNAPGPRIHGAVRADLALGGRADRVPVLDGRAAEERLVIEELDRVPLEPASRESEFRTVHLVLGLLE